MDYNQFKKLHENGEVSKKESINLLFEFVNEFPYFQTAHALLAKAMHEQQHVRYERQLKIAAAYSGDRKSLSKMIHPGELKLVGEKVNIIERVEIPKPVFQEDPSENIFTDRSEQIIPPAEESIEKEIATASVEPFEHSAAPIEHNDIPSPIVYYSDDMNYDEMEPEEDYDETPVSDPHEIIRRRLNEILGYKEDINKKEKVAIESSHAESIENTILPPETKPEKEVVFSNEAISREEIKEEIVETSDGTEKDFLDRLTIESKKAIDVIDKGELEYALEASLIQSLENLPIIEKPEIKEKTEIAITKEFTFYEWLKVYSKGAYGKIEEVHAYESNTAEIQADPVIEETSLNPPVTEIKKAGFDQLIDRFIEADPKIIASRTEFYSPVNQAKKSITENEDIVSETLAKIYQQQGNLLKARATYQKLSLLNPDRMTYFAALISEIEKAINNQNKQDL